MPTKRTALPLYREILADAWRLSLTHRHLWVFGFFATLIGFGGVSEILLGAYNHIADALPGSIAIQQTPLMILPGFATLRALVNLSPSPLLSISIFTISILFLFAVFAWIISLSIGGLVNNIRKIERGGKPTFAQGLKAGSTTMPRVLTINLGAKIAIGLTFLLTGANLLQLLTDRSVVSLFFFLCSYILFTILGVIISLVSVFATNYTVINERPVADALLDGWHITKKNWLISLEMVIILMLINIGLSLLALLLTMLISVPLVFLFVFAAVIKSATLMAIMISLTLLVLIGFLVVAVSFLTTFQASAWTLLWIRLNGRRTHHPKITRLADWFQDRLKD